MKRSEVTLGLLRIPMDILAVLAALLLSYSLRVQSRDLLPGVQLLDPPLSLPDIDTYISSFVMPGIIIFVILAAMMRLYALRSPLGGTRELARVAVVTILWLVAVMTWYFFVRKQLFYSRILLMHSTTFILLFVTLGRMGVLLLKHALLRHGIGVHLVVSVGETPIARIAKETLGRNKQYEYLGHLDHASALKALMSKCRPDLVLQTDPDERSEQTIKLIEYCRAHHLGYGFLPPVLAEVPHQLEVERLGLLPMIRFRPTPLDGWGRIFKRAFDFFASIILIILLAPVFVVAAAAVLLDSGFPVLYVSRRIGEHGRTTIPVLKFRSMVKDADAKKNELLHRNERRDGPLFKMRDDPRVTRVGRALRRFDIDELPQLFNVLAGQLSLVGPRPHLPEEVEKYKAHERRVFAVKPGMTGLAQVSGRSDLSFRDEVRFDLQYVEEWSFLLDVHIIVKTVLVVLLGRRRRG